MKAFFPATLAVCFAIAWWLALAAFPLFLETFSDFKVEMPPLTVAMMALYRVGFWFLLGSGVLAVAVLLAMRFRFGWWLALGFNGLLDLYLLGMLMPLIALINGLSGGDEAVGFMVIRLEPEPDPMLYAKVSLGAAVLNQVVKVALITGRRAFSR